MDNNNPAATSSALMTPPTTPSAPSLNLLEKPRNGRNASGSSNGSGSGPRLIVDFSDLTVPVPTCPRTVGPEELRRLFLVSLEKMFTLEPESLPFRQPVDPEALGIPDYPDIIRKPMDLQTIRIKMNCLRYTDPWMFVDDVLLMFDNAWVYNRPASKVYQYCTKLAEVFQQEINPVMQRLGYRHGRIHQFNAQTLSCFGRPVCLITRNATYYNFLRFHLCEKCFTSNLEDDGVKLPWQNNVSVNKENFVKLINDSENSYSPAVEMHRAYQRDAEMSRQLVIREFLKLLHSTTTRSDKKENIRKMLRLNPQLRAEFMRTFTQQRDQGQLSTKEIDKIKYQLSLLEQEVGDSNAKEKEKALEKERAAEEENRLEEEEDDDEFDDGTTSSSHSWVNLRLNLRENDEDNSSPTNNEEASSSSSSSNKEASSPNGLSVSASSSSGLGLDLESSSGGSNCSTLSSLKSFN